MKRILVVDDEPTIRAVVADVLELSGYEVETASNGEEALRKVRACPPDGVFLDLMMPVMDGWTFAAEVRKDPAYAAIPIAVMSAAQNARATAQQLGAAAVLSKPFAIDDILDAVARFP